MTTQQNRYFYSESLGLKEIEPNSKMYDSSFNTKEEALVSFYQKTRTGKVNYINELELKLKRRKLEVQELDKQFQYLKDSHPELFL